VRLKLKLINKIPEPKYCYVLPEPKQFIAGVFCRCRCPNFQGSFESDNNITVMCKEYSKHIAKIQDILE
jgi:hypothetical protein